MQTQTARVGAVLSAAISRYTLTRFWPVQLESDKEELMALLAHTGTFDVENYGDLLFPLLVKKRLPNFEHVFVSPRGGDPVWHDCVSSIPFEKMLEIGCSAVIVGGGNIIHPNRSRLSTYRAAGVDQHGYADLWIGSALCMTAETPVIWNAPGVPSAIALEYADLVRSALMRTRYISVRDAESRKLLSAVCPECEISLVPDSAWDLPELWSTGELDAEFSALIGTQKAIAENYVSIHLNDRYLKDLSVAATARTIDRLCEAAKATPILIAIGRCHDDHLLAQKVARKLKSSPILLDQPQSLRQICAAISRSKYYFGSSMHGYITAASFGIPAIMVAKKMVKFDGVVRVAGAPETLVHSWKDVHKAFEEIDPIALSKTFRQKQREASAQLAFHWARVATELRSPSLSDELSKESFSLDDYRKTLGEAASRRRARRRFLFSHEMLIKVVGRIWRPRNNIGL